VAVLPKRRRRAPVRRGGRRLPRGLCPGAPGPRHRAVATAESRPWPVAAVLQPARSPSTALSSRTSAEWHPYRAVLGRSRWRRGPCKQRDTQFMPRWLQRLRRAPTVL